MTKLELWTRIFDSVCLFNRGRSDIRSMTSVLEDTQDAYDLAYNKFKENISNGTTPPYYVDGISTTEKPWTTGYSNTEQ